MAKLCPITNEPVVYLTCLDCDEKTCLDIGIDDRKHAHEPQKKELKIDVTLYIPVTDEGDKTPVDLAHDFLLKVCEQFGCDYCSSCVEAEIREMEE